jgi:DNA-directed RNA polymerase specialized sigma24 family protein
MSSHILVQDPSSISSRFSSINRIGYEGDGDAEDDLQRLIEEKWSPEDEIDLDAVEGGPNFAAIDPHLDRIPEREADLIRLYYRDQMKQEQIARLFGITQAAVSYRLARGRRRIQFLQTIPELDKNIFHRELGLEFIEQDLEILWRMYETTCQSEVAKLMGLTQGRVRHRFFRSKDRIKELIEKDVREKRAQLLELRRRNLNYELNEIDNEELEEIVLSSKYGKYYTVFSAISDKHFNILHEVSLPQFVNRGEAQILTIE